MATNSLEYSRLWRAKNRQKIREYQQKWYGGHPAKRRAYEKAWRKKNKARVRFYRIRLKYGLSKDEYMRLLTQQSFKCKACEIDLQSIAVHQIHIDHCHKSKAIRAILCGPCNRALGLMKDDAKRLQKLTNYAAKFS